MTITDEQGKGFGTVRTVGQTVCTESEVCHIPSKLVDLRGMEGQAACTRTVVPLLMAYLRMNQEPGRGER